VVGAGASVTDAVKALEATGTLGIGLGQIFYGASLETMFYAPGVPVEFGGAGGDSRTPDIIVQPNVGGIYTKSTKKRRPPPTSNPDECRHHCPLNGG